MWPPPSGCRKGHLSLGPVGQEGVHLCEQAECGLRVPDLWVGPQPSPASWSQGGWLAGLHVP